MSNTLTAFQLTSTSSFCNADEKYEKLPFSITKGVPSSYKYLDLDCKTNSSKDKDGNLTIETDCDYVVKYKNYSYNPIPRHIQNEDYRVRKANAVYFKRFEYPDYQPTSTISNIISGCMGSALTAAGILYSYRFDDEFIKHHTSHKSFEYINNALRFLRKKWLFVSPISALGAFTGVALWKWGSYLGYQASKLSNTAYAKTFIKPSKLQNNRETAVQNLLTLEHSLDSLNTKLNMNKNLPDCTRTNENYVSYSPYSTLIRSVQAAREDLGNRHTHLEKVLNRDAPLK